MLLSAWRESVRGACRVLYFAPEPRMLERLRSWQGMQFVTSDLYAPGVDVRADITNLPFEVGSFDAIICSHVLEHIPDDRKAMRELQRVLKPGGQAFIQVPLFSEMAMTDEDPNIVDPKERERRFGQFDHVRLYGRDIAQRLAGAGFVVHRENPVRHLAEELACRFGLWDDTIYRCVKPIATNRPPIVSIDVASFETG